MICFFEFGGRTGHQPAELHFQQGNPGREPRIAIASFYIRSTRFSNRLDRQAGESAAVRYSRRSWFSRFIEYRGRQSASWRGHFRGMLTRSNYRFLNVTALAPVPAPAASPPAAFFLRPSRRWGVPGTFHCLLDFAGDRHGRFQRLRIPFEWQFCLRLRDRRRRQCKLSCRRSPRFHWNLPRRSAKPHRRFLRFDFPIRASESLRSRGIPFRGVGILPQSFEIFCKFERHHGVARLLVEIR